jgi:hypothetical protein
MGQDGRDGRLSAPGLFLVASGAPQTAGSTYLKAGKAVSARVGLGTNAVAYTEANTYTAALPSTGRLPSGGALPSSGLLPSPGLRPGEGALLPAAPRRHPAWSAAGVRSAVRSKAGAATAVLVAAGRRFSTFVESGTASLGLQASGARDTETLGETGRQLGSPTVTVTEILRVDGQAHTRGQGDPTSQGPYIIHLAGPAHARGQGVPGLSGRATPAGLLHERDLGEPQVDAVTLELLALDRVH